MYLHDTRIMCVSSMYLDDTRILCVSCRLSSLYLDDTRILWDTSKYVYLAHAPEDRDEDLRTVRTGIEDEHKMWKTQCLGVNRVHWGVWTYAPKCYVTRVWLGVNNSKWCEYNVTGCEYSPNRYQYHLMRMWISSTRCEHGSNRCEYGTSRCQQGIIGHLHTHL